MVERGKLSPLRFLYDFTWRWCAMIVPNPISISSKQDLRHHSSPHPASQTRFHYLHMYLSSLPQTSGPFNGPLFLTPPFISFPNHVSPPPPRLPRPWKTMTTHPPPIPHLRRPPSKRVRRTMSSPPRLYPHPLSSPLVSL